MQRITYKNMFYCNEIMRLLFLNDLNISLDKSEINTRRGSKLLYHAKLQMHIMKRNLVLLSHQQT